MPPDELEVVEGELLPDVIDHPQPATLFRSDDPKLVVARAVEVADELARIIRDRKLAVRISGKEHVLVGGWTLLGTMLGVFPVLEWTRKLEDGWEARVEARTLDGRVVGAAESECLSSERKWGRADDYAIRSMAATRATSKALRMPLGFVMELAGFDATPADEIPAEDTPGTAPGPSSGPIPDEVKADQLQAGEIAMLIRSLDKLDPGTDWRSRCVEITGAPWSQTTRTMAAELVRQLTIELDALTRGPDEEQPAA